MIPPMAATTELHIVKYANDASTVIKETTVTWQWMRDNLPVQGDGVTHYYHQGPVFNTSIDPWNPAEDTNVQEKDYGAVKGTNLKDLCNLIGGLSPGEEVTLKAIDGMTKNFAYRNVYEYTSRQGPMVITWSNDGTTPDTGYNEAMKLVFFADKGVNPWGIHAFGNYDWHESADSKYWYYYYQGSNKYPTTTGLAVKYISEVIIYSTIPASEVQQPAAAFSATPVIGPAPLTVQFTDLSTGSPASWAWDFTNDGSVDSTQKNPSYTFTTAGTYTVKLTSINSYGNTSETKRDYITVSALSGNAPAAAFSATPRSGTAPLMVRFTDSSTGPDIIAWEWDFNNDGITDSNDKNPRFTYNVAGIYPVNLTVSNAYGASSEVKNQFIRVTGAQGTEVSRSLTAVQQPAMISTAPAAVSSHVQQATVKKTLKTVVTGYPAASETPAESPGPDVVIIVGTLVVCGLGNVVVQKYRLAKR